jgi:hypothetical protein
VLASGTRHPRGPPTWNTRPGAAEDASTGLAAKKTKTNAIAGRRSPSLEEEPIVDAAMA